MNKVYKIDKEDFNPQKEKINNIFNVFGHSIMKEVVVTDNYAMVDTGAAYSVQKGYGKLSALHYPSLEIKLI